MLEKIENVFKTKKKNNSKNYVIFWTQYQQRSEYKMLQHL